LYIHTFTSRAALPDFVKPNRVRVKDSAKERKKIRNEEKKFKSSHRAGLSITPVTAWKNKNNAVGKLKEKPFDCIRLRHLDMYVCVRKWIGGWFTLRFEGRYYETIVFFFTSIL
jgi:hypothetical protein